MEDLPAPKSSDVDSDADAPTDHTSEVAASSVGMDPDNLVDINHPFTVDDARHPPPPSAAEKADKAAADASLLEMMTDPPAAAAGRTDGQR